MSVEISRKYILTSSWFNV